MMMRMILKMTMMIMIEVVEWLLLRTETTINVFRRPILMWMRMRTRRITLKMMIMMEVDVWPRSDDHQCLSPTNPDEDQDEEDDLYQCDQKCQSATFGQAILIVIVMMLSKPSIKIDK